MLNSHPLPHTEAQGGYIGGVSPLWSVVRKKPPAIWNINVPLENNESITQIQTLTASLLEQAISKWILSLFWPSMIWCNRSRGRQTILDKVAIICTESCSLLCKRSLIVQSNESAVRQTLWMICDLCTNAEFVPGRGSVFTKWDATV